MQQRNPNNCQGIDVSHYQGSIDWSQVKSAGKTFAIIKATEGQQYVDSVVYDNYNNAKAADLAVGLYHFCRATSASDAVKEAQFFASVFDACGGLTGLDIPPVLDIETVVARDPATVVAIAKAFLGFLENRYGIKPMIYTFPNFMDNYLDDSLSSYPLWYANYGNTLDQDRNGWTKWEFLQYTDQGNVPGINGPVDLDEYGGDVSQLLYRMDTKIANELIEVCKAHYAIAASQQERDAWHARAVEIRKAAGLPDDS